MWDSKLQGLMQGKAYPIISPRASRWQLRSEQGARHRFTLLHTNTLMDETCLFVFPSSFFSQALSAPLLAFLIRSEACFWKASPTCPLFHIVLPSWLQICSQGPQWALNSPTCAPPTLWAKAINIFSSILVPWKCYYVLHGLTDLFKITYPFSYRCELEE